MIMGVCRYTALDLSKIQDRQSLMLHWPSFVQGGSNIVAGQCAPAGIRYFDYGLTLSRNPGINHDATLEIGDTLLTLISRMWQWAYALPFYI
jgi:hypothetical protein